ncbi:MAG: SBBP repeat-containing protein [Ignavibacteria bacterium]|nr:SBBP repeat-containing protein [Ignavibacteria bacterium]
MATDASGNIYVTGQSKGPTIFSEYATIKYNSAGVQQWVSRYNGPGSGNDIARSMALDGYGNVYVTGNSRGSVGFDDYATIKYNSAGDSQWVARYDGRGTIPRSAVQLQWTVRVMYMSQVSVTEEADHNMTMPQ